MKKFQVAAAFDGCQTMKDRSVKLVFYTSKEMSGEDTRELFSLVHNEGWLLFSPNELSEQDIPDEKATVRGQKTHAQRLRAALYVLWQQSGSKDDFDTVYYPQQMERFIDKVKGLLEPY